MTRRSFPFSLGITSATFTGSKFTPAAWDATGKQVLQLKTGKLALEEAMGLSQDRLEDDVGGSGGDGGGGISIFVLLDSNKNSVANNWIQTDGRMVLLNAQGFFPNFVTNKRLWKALKV